MAETLGTIRGQMILDVKQALASYTSARQAHVATVTALHTGAGAMIQAGAAVAGVGAVMVGGFLAAVNAAGEFERKLDFFGAVSASTQKEMDAVRTKAIQLGQDTIYSAGQIADSFVELGKAGVSAQQIIGGVGEAVAHLGAAADIPLDTAANIITAAIQTFHLGADQAVGVADKLAGAANASIVDVQDLGTSLKYVGGVAATFGLSFNDVNTALAVLGTAGIKGSTAGTSLRQTLTSLNGATKGATAELKDLGIITADGTNRFFDMNGSLKPLPQVFQILQDALKGLSAEQQVSAIKTIFQQRAISTVAALAHAGAAGFEEMSKSIDKTTAAEVAGKRLNNLSGDIEILRGNIETMTITAGSGFQSTARSVVQFITSVIGSFNQLPKDVQAGIVTTVGVVGGILVAVGFLGMFAGSLMNIIALGIQLAPVFTGLGEAIAGLAKGIAAMNVAVASSPWGRIAALIGLVITAILILYNTNAQFRAAVQPIWDAILNIFQQIGPVIANVMSWLSAFLSGLVGGAANAGTGFIGMLSSLASTLSGVLSGALQTILPPLLTFVQTILSGLMPVIQAVLPLIVTLAQILGAVLGGNLAALPGLVLQFAGQFQTVITAMATQLIPMVIQMITNLIVALIGMLPTIITAGITLFTGLLTAVATILPSLITTVLNVVLQLIMLLVGLLPQLITLFVGVFLQIINALVAMIPVLVPVIVGMITTILQMILVVVPQLITTLLTILPLLITAIVGMIPLLIQAGIQLFLALIQAILIAVPQILVALIQAIPKILIAIVNAIPLIISSAIKLFLGIITALVTALPQIIIALVNAIPRIIVAIVNAIPLIISAAIKLFLGLITGLLQALPQIITAVIGMVPQIVKALIAAAPQLAAAGVHLIQGLINGIGSMVGKLWDAAVGLAKKVVGAVANIFHLGSPSKLFNQYGVWLIQGLINGIGAMANDAVNAVSTVANAVAGVQFANDSLSGLSDSIAISKQLAIGNATIGVDAQTQQLKDLNDRLTDIANKDTVHVEKVEINNPDPEPASDSLPNTIRKLADA